ARLPASAIDAANTVLVIAEDDRLEVAPVELLRRQGDDVIVRASALSGRSVVAERTPFLGAGIRVRPVAPPDESASSGSVTAEPELVELDADRRAKLVAFIEGNQRMPADAKERLLTQLSQPMVPARTVARLEARMGG
ncbi:MAG: efflux transporter periplasmic adaptor subunit, partial [Alphaproteobacteria bacterium]|nr:efflux transporter periplasmic adaptor subunit [Alphaproteobacteria bacterium]